MVVLFRSLHVTMITNVYQLILWQYICHSSGRVRVLSVQVGCCSCPALHTLHQPLCRWRVLSAGDLWCGCDVLTPCIMHTAPGHSLAPRPFYSRGQMAAADLGWSPRLRSVTRDHVKMWRLRDIGALTLWRADRCTLHQPGCGNAPFIIWFALTIERSPRRCRWTMNRLSMQINPMIILIIVVLLNLIEIFDVVLG